ncbi:TRAP transporter permease [Desulfovibrio sp. OttesenSCG-928-C06]|nr:TRAP transporter permease [Desulfovibrio sp. OttesenSCG-928-C06]
MNSSSTAITKDKGPIDFQALLKKYDSESRYRLLFGWQGILVTLLAVSMSCFHFYTSGFGLLQMQAQGAVHLTFALALTFILYPASRRAPQTSKLKVAQDYILMALSFYVSGYVSWSYLEFFIANNGAVSYADMLVGGLVLFSFLLFLFNIFMRTTGRNFQGVPPYDLGMAIMAVCANMYLVINHMELVQRAGLPTWSDLIMGYMLIVLVLEATRRVSNPVLPSLAILALLYCYFGRSMPDVLQHKGFSITRIINHMYLGGEGLFSTPLEVSSTFVFMFILFGAVLERAGIGKFIIDISLALAGRTSGGPAKVAVIASGLTGTISGSSVANVCTTGMFTIPLMKSVGYRPHFAGAVEAVASTGGQIMPPVMGAGAFIMATFVGESYIAVATAAIVPALLYYAAVMLQVHLEAKRLGLKGIAKENLPNAGRLMRKKGFLLLPLFGIVIMLVMGFTPFMAAFIGILICIPLSFLNHETRLTPKKLMEAFEAGARSSLAVACACACVGLIVGTSTLTGLALKIANTIVDLSGGMLLPTLILTMCASVFLGIGLPTTANFIVTSTMAAPALKLLELAPGVPIPDMAIYMFVFYFGIAADLTPPVALAAYAGAGIAKADPMRTGVTAFKLALAGFIVPYIYVYNPILLLVGATPLPFIMAVATALLGVFLLSMSTIGFYRINMPWYLRVLALGGALSLLMPGTVSDIAGFAILVFIHVIQTIRMRNTGNAAQHIQGDTAQ